MHNDRRFIVRLSDYVLPDFDGFIRSRPKSGQAPVCVEQVRSNEVVPWT
jgi:hypothetical protein